MTKKQKNDKEDFYEGLSKEEKEILEDGQLTDDEIEKLEKAKEEYYSKKISEYYHKKTCDFCGESPANNSLGNWDLCDSCFHAL